MLRQLLALAQVVGGMTAIAGVLIVAIGTPAPSIDAFSIRVATVVVVVVVVVRILSLVLIVCRCCRVGGRLIGCGSLLSACIVTELASVS